MKYYNYPDPRGTEVAEDVDSKNISEVAPSELPDASSASAGNALVLDENKKPVWGEVGGGVIVGKATGTGESSGGTIEIETTLTENYLNSIGAFDEDGAFAKAVFVSIPDGKLTSPYYTYENGTVLAPLFGTGVFRHRIYETGINNSGTICIYLVESKN